MVVTLCKAKIHRARVTQAELYYEGSLTVDTELLKASGILPYEKVQVVNVNNGARFETYIIPGKAKSGIICLNGPAARLGTVGDEVVIISYAEFEESEAKGYEPIVVLVDQKNKIKRIIKGHLEEPTDLK
ncbi:MAG: aspartate 1-decarboxylase [Bacteroidetes bacterium]|nr:aspartate 1-decarboxylase [Bacteroidota bacterium]MCL5737751.1 aspartate 1-decarboxylase [Bacteroidota bacterium]